MNRAKKSFFNVSFGLVNQIVTLLFGLIVPRLFITTFGSEVNGLQSSIAYLYTYIALLEAGIGMATVQALYSPLAKGSTEGVNAVLAATNIQYRKIAKVYGLVITVASLIFPLSIKTQLGYFTIAAMFFLSGLSSLVSFLFHGKFVLLLQADGRTYVVSIFSLCVYILTNVLKIVLIFCGLHFVFVYCINAVISVAVASFYYYYRKKNYSWVNYRTTPNMKAISQSNNVVVHQISGVLCNSTDVLVLTYVVGSLALVSVYNIYLMIFDAIRTIINNIFSSVHFILGQTFNLDVEKYKRYHHIYEILDMMVSFTLYSIAYIMITPFLTLYTRGITDIQYIDKFLPLLFVLVKLLSSCREPASQLINFAGHFKQTQNRSMIETGINLVVSIVASYFIGIYGVLLGTIVALAYRTIDMYIYTSTRFLDRSLLVSLWLWIEYMGAFAVVIFVFSHITICVESYLQFFAVCFVIGSIMLLYYFAITSIFHFDVIRSIWSFANVRIKQRRGASS